MCFIPVCPLAFKTEATQARYVRARSLLAVPRIPVDTLCDLGSTERERHFEFAEQRWLLRASSAPRHVRNLAGRALSRITRDVLRKRPDYRGVRTAHVIVEDSTQPHDGGAAMIVPV